MEERASFVSEVLPFVSQEEPFSLEQFLEQAEKFVRTSLAQVSEPAGDPSPVMFIEREGEISVIAWGYVSTDFQEHFLDRLVPATLESHDPPWWPWR
jgi:hypothetical protein